MKIAVAFDHRGIALRAPVISELLALGHEVLDLGTDSPMPMVDYPDKALDLGEALRVGRVERGVLVCGSGVGAAIAANKIPGVRACLCHDTVTVRLGVQRDDLNVLCLGPDIVGKALVREIVRAFAEAELVGGERYQRRLEKLEALERLTPDAYGIAR
jgi:ribose 5-phosphate isomerase B